MANYLKGKNQAYYNKHSSRITSKTATRAEKAYSYAWYLGFHEVWDDDGINDIRHCKSSFEKTAYKRGQKFAKKVIDDN